MLRRSLLASALVLPFATGAFAQGSNTPEGVVRALYAAHMRAIAARNPARGVLDDPRLLQRFFSPGIESGVRRLRRGGRTTTDALGFDPITDSRDQQISDLRVRLFDGGAVHSLVDAEFRAGARNVRLRYQVSLVGDDWLVAGIEKIPARGEQGWSLNERLDRRR